MGIAWLRVKSQNCNKSYNSFVLRSDVCLGGLSQVVLDDTRGTGRNYNQSILLDLVVHLVSKFDSQDVPQRFDL